MKFKYYLRGIGIGIIFASIIFLIAYRENVPAKMSNEEIVERAKQLGMVEANDPINKLIDKKSDNKSDENASEEKEPAEKVSTEEIKTEAENTEATTEEQTTEATTTEEQTTEEQTTETKTTEAKTTEARTSEQQAAEKQTTEEKNTKKSKTIEITIARGSSSYPVCLKLKELGLIDDAAKYDDYLIEHGYANRISVGTHKLKMGMSYHDIAELISDPLEEKE
ncbi:MAG: hypothetical protein IJ232_05140 [Lachnospiraceae bacterium]|nr:hypothetical protein [Lachnospiraceae bacterium]